jgi:hypothetical protein
MQHFDGKTYNPALDKHRLNKQLGRVFEVLKDGQWHTLGEIEKRTGDPQASISARVRDLRKPRFGSFNVEHNRVIEGLWQYRIKDGADAVTAAKVT